ncbi:uncharacterized protein LOC135475406 [Liolophura sinensis]|uniref:uncharacterized protein LOC135475406 n=1 Tax=Liolophura sinensis TaxID=3198878 RepID=UPI0031587DCE
MESGVSVTERLRLRRDKGRGLLHKIGVAQLALGAVAIILGAVTLVYAAPNGTFIYYIGTPLWCGLFLLIGGFLGIKGSHERDGPGDLPTGRQRAFIVANYGLTITVMTPALLTVVYCGIAVAWCTKTPPTDYQDACKHFPNENTLMAIINVITGTMITLTTIPCMIFYCLYARAFGLRVNNYMSTATDPIVEEQMRQQADVIRQQQEEIQRLAQRQNVMEKQLTSGHTPMDAPPPYDEPVPAVGVEKA